MITLNLEANKAGRDVYKAPKGGNIWNHQKQINARKFTEFSKAERYFLDPDSFAIHT